MAKYDVRFSCGHHEEKQLFGPEKDRQRYIGWAGEYGSCEACRSADKAAQIDAREMELGLPTLTGSDKQIAWARKIRSEKIGEILDHLQNRILPRVAEANRDKYEQDRAVLMQELCGQAAAKYWIDNRDHGGWSLALALVKAARQ